MAIVHFKVENGRVAVNTDKIAFVTENMPEDKEATFIFFSGKDDDYMTLELPYSEVIEQLFDCTMSERKVLPPPPFMIREIIGLSHTEHAGKHMGYRVVRSADSVTVAQYFFNWQCLPHEPIGITAAKAKEFAERAVSRLTERGAMHLPAKR